MQRTDGGDREQRAEGRRQQCGVLQGVAVINRQAGAQGRRRVPWLVERLAAAGELSGRLGKT